MKTLDRCFSIDACISAVRSCSHDSMEWPLGATPSASCAKHEVKRGRICVTRVGLGIGLGLGIGIGIELGLWIALG